MAGSCGAGNGPDSDETPDPWAGDWMAFAKSHEPGGLAVSEAVLELTLSSSVEENKIACPGLRPALWAHAGLVAASTTPATTAHCVKLAKLKPTSNCQASCLDSPRQK